MAGYAARQGLNKNVIRPSSHPSFQLSYAKSRLKNPLTTDDAPTAGLKRALSKTDLAIHEPSRNQI